MGSLKSFRYADKNINLKENEDQDKATKEKVCLFVCFWIHVLS